MLLEKLQTLNPPGKKSLHCISAIGHLLLHVCHPGPTLQSFGFSPGLGMAQRDWQVGEGLTKLETCPRWAGKLAFSALSACFCVVQHPFGFVTSLSQGFFCYLSRSPQQSFKSPWLPTGRGERSGALFVFLDGKSPPVLYLCWISSSEPFRSGHLESCTARIIQAHFKRWWHS